MKIYVVTSGCYSDYHIDAVFDDHEKAEVYVAANDSINDPVYIETYDTDDMVIESDGKPIACIVYTVAFRNHNIENPRIVDYHESWVIYPMFDVIVKPDICRNLCYVTVLTDAGIEKYKTVFQETMPRFIDACKDLMKTGALKP